MTSPALRDIPPSILAAAQQTRALFGDKVKLLFVADERTGETKGNAKWDDPARRFDMKNGYNPYDTLNARKRDGDVVEPDFAPEQHSGSITVTEHELPEPNSDPWRGVRVSKPQTRL